MFIGKWSGGALILVILALDGAAPAAWSQPEPGQQPSPEAVAKLIAQLGAARFQSREEASKKLEELGSFVVPALRNARTAATEVEAQRRIEVVLARIENNLLKGEEKRWHALDVAQRGIKDRLLKILARPPALTNQQKASAIYLLTVGRPPTRDEVEQAQQALAEASGPTASALALARSLVQGKESCAAVAAVNVRLTKVKADLAGPMLLAEKLHRLNTDEFQKVLTDAAGSLTKAVKADEPLIDLAFLLVLARFPRANETEKALAHLKQADRQLRTSDVLWALTNTKEFLQPE
jgi:hypothetical protein